MQRVLHLLTENDPAVPKSVIPFQQEEPGVEVRVIDLTSMDVDYDRLLDEIFSADSVYAW